MSANRKQTRGRSPGREPFSEAAPKVDFLVCGVKKAGTSALDQYLRLHEDITMANWKEVHYFDRDENFLGAVDHRKYHAAFPEKPNDALMGESTPSYIYWNDAPRRIWEYNNLMKLIVVLRNPIERAFSDWCMEYARGNEKVCFSDAIRMEADRVRSQLPRQSRLHSYVDRGRYVPQLRRLWFFFGRDGVLVLRYEKLRRQPREALNEVFRFLNIPGFGSVDQIIVNSGRYQEPMKLEDKRYLRCIFEFEVRQLERELGWDCADWLE